jgi:hypothetical protein
MQATRCNGPSSSPRASSWRAHPAGQGPGHEGLRHDPAVGAEGRQVAVRVVFERTVFDTEQRLKKIEPLNDPNMYRGFFEKLSKALFLEAHEF